MRCVVGAEGSGVDTERKEGWSKRERECVVLLHKNVGSGSRVSSAPRPSTGVPPSGLGCRILLKREMNKVVMC